MLHGLGAAVRIGEEEENDGMMVASPFGMEPLPESHGYRWRGQVNGEADNLVRFLAEGRDSPTVRAELRRIEEVLEPFRARLIDLEQSPLLRSPKVHPAWVWAKLERLDELLRQDPAQGKAEIAKHLDGDLTISPLPSPAWGATGGDQRADKTEQPPDGPGGSLPTIGCGGWI